MVQIRLNAFDHMLTGRTAGQNLAVFQFDSNNTDVRSPMHFRIGRVKSARSRRIVVEASRRQAVRGQVLPPARSRPHSASGGCEFQFCAQETKHPSAFNGHRFRHGQNQAAPLCCGDEGECNARFS